MMNDVRANRIKEDKKDRLKLCNDDKKIKIKQNKKKK